jgi:flavin reductase (DIM6/NTAB) family NADH-FMN oxidoreductase RutF
MMELMVIIRGHCGSSLPWYAGKVATRFKSDSDAKIKLQVSKVHLPRLRGATAWPHCSLARMK